MRHVQFFIVLILFWASFGLGESILVFTGIPGVSKTSMLSRSYLTPMKILIARNKHNVRYDAGIKCIAKIFRGSPIWKYLCPSPGGENSRGHPLEGMLCGNGLLWFPMLMGARP